MRLVVFFKTPTCLFITIESADPMAIKGEVGVLKKLKKKTSLIRSRRICKFKSYKRKSTLFVLKTSRGSNFIKFLHKAPSLLFVHCFIFFLTLYNQHCNYKETKTSQREKRERERERDGGLERESAKPRGGAGDVSGGYVGHSKATVKSH